MSGVLYVIFMAPCTFSFADMSLPSHVLRSSSAVTNPVKPPLPFPGRISGTLHCVPWSLSSSWGLGIVPDSFLSPDQMLVTCWTNRSCMQCPLNTPSVFTSLQFCVHDFHDGYTLSAALFKCSALFKGQCKLWLVCEIVFGGGSAKYWHLPLNHLSAGCGTYTILDVIICIFVVYISSLPSYKLWS